MYMKSLLPFCRYASNTNRCKLNAIKSLLSHPNSRFVIFILIGLNVGLTQCKKRPFNPRNEHIGTWEFKRKTMTSTVIEMDSNLRPIAYDREECEFELMSSEGRIRYKRKDELKIDYFNNDNWSEYHVSKNGIIGYNEEDSHNEKVTQLRGEFLSNDSMYITLTHSYNYSTTVTTISGKKVD